MTEYKYRGARSSVKLHEEELRRFIEVWNRAKSAGLELPPDDDPDFASLDPLLAHVFRWARTYLVWICEQLDLPDPGLDPVPAAGDMDSGASAYANHLLRDWGTQLADVSPERFFKETYAAPWGILYCIDAMLEHAVMHPLKHRFQLEELMGNQNAHRDSG